jgi:hypothetical protein
MTPKSLQMSRFCGGRRFDNADVVPPVEAI